MATVEMVGSHADGEFLHSAEVKNLRHAINGAGVFGHTISLTVTGADRVITIPAFSGMVPDGSGGLKAFSYAGGSVTADTGEAAGPRIDIAVYDASEDALALTKGTATAESGDVDEAPMPDLANDQIMVFRIRMEQSADVLEVENVEGRAFDITNHSEWELVGSNTTEATMTGTTAADLDAITGLNILTSQPIKVIGVFRKAATAANRVALGLKLNSTVVLEATAGTTVLGRSSATQQAEDGWFECIIYPRSTSYLTGLRARWATKVAASGAAAEAETACTGLAALLPNATVTSLTIRGINDTANNNLALKEWYVFAGRPA